MIKGNESDVGYIDFELQAKRGDKFLCFRLFLMLKNCSYLQNQMSDWDGIWIVRQWHSHWGARGAKCHPWQRKICQKLGKEVEIGKNLEKRGKSEEKAKNGKVLSLCPSWQIGLAMPLTCFRIITILLILPQFGNETQVYPRNPRRK